MSGDKDIEEIDMDMADEEEDGILCIYVQSVFPVYFLNKT